MFAPRVKSKIYLYDLHKDSLYSYTLCSFINEFEIIVGRHNETRNEMKNCDFAWKCGWNRIEISIVLNSPVINCSILLFIIRPQIS